MQLQAKKKGKEGKKTGFLLELPGWELGWLGRRTTFTLASSCGSHCYAHLVNNPHTEVAGPPGGTLGPYSLPVSLSSQLVIRPASMQRRGLVPLLALALLATRSRPPSK